MYVYWLFGLSAAFVLVERILPRYQQHILRDGIGLDVFYLLFNGHFLGLLLAKVSAPFIDSFDLFLGKLHLREALYSGVASQLSFGAQLILALIIVDFFHWGAPTWFRSTRSG